MPSAQIAIRLDLDLLNHLDEMVAGGRYESRAAAVRAALEAAIELERQDRIDQVITAGYRRIPPTLAEDSSATASLRAAIVEEPW